MSKSISELADSIPSLINSLLEGVTKQLVSFDPTQFPPLEASLEKVVKSAVKETIKHDTTDRLRKHQVFLRNLEPEKGDSDSLEIVCEKINADAPTKFFRLKGEKGIRPLILQFTTPEQAIKFIQQLSKSKRAQNFPFPSLIARPNYTPEEEKVYHHAWAEACKLNDAVGRKEHVD
ncbi:hypothetical protein PRIPAC_80215 [Pristionchus pacificus]|uniref:Uncharacterized protein n=1 Tax=Pristionchus pacificus TaxID=54126 RepID=A0A2A6C424_PRIPA|nr:hypothetical protein PRIPAC_80215 [Pristionchus pacificus]|eukprot:PDM72857.1 hypothetical protein PRIPAC_39291 [Pristionchus pacificus]